MNRSVIGRGEENSQICPAEVGLTSAGLSVGENGLAGLLQRRLASLAPAAQAPLQWPLQQVVAQR